MKLLFLPFLCLCCILHHLPAFGPVTMVKEGRFLSNAAALPLEPTGDSTTDGYILRVWISGNRSTEQLLKDGLLIKERIIVKNGDKRTVEERKGGEIVYQALIGRDGLISESWEQEEYTYSYGQDSSMQNGLQPLVVNELSYHYTPSGRLSLRRGPGGMLVDFQEKQASYQTQGERAALFATNDRSDEITVLWEGDSRPREIVRTHLPDGSIRERERTGAEEEIRLYGAENRLLEIRGRTSAGYFLEEYRYNEQGLASVSSRMEGIREESIIFRNEAGTITGVETYRNQERIQRIMRSGDLFQVFRYRNGELLFKADAGKEQIHRYLEPYRTLTSLEL
jgi:hypothetical protein